VIASHSRVADPEDIYLNLESASQKTNLCQNPRRNSVQVGVVSEAEWAAWAEPTREVCLGRIVDSLSAAPRPDIAPGIEALDAGQSSPHGGGGGGGGSGNGGGNHPQPKQAAGNKVQKQDGGAAGISDSLERPHPWKAAAETAPAFAASAASAAAAPAAAESAGSELAEPRQAATPPQLHGSAADAAPQPALAADTADAGAAALAASGAGPPAGGQLRGSPAVMAVRTAGGSLSTLRFGRQSPGASGCGARHDPAAARQLRSRRAGLFAVTMPAGGGRRDCRLLAMASASSIEDGPASGSRTVASQATADDRGTGSHRSMGPPTQPEPAQPSFAGLQAAVGVGGAAGGGGSDADAEDARSSGGDGSGYDGGSESGDLGEAGITCDEEVCSLDSGDDLSGYSS